MNVLDIQISKNYTKDTADQFGAIKGAPCKIDSYSYDEDGNTILKFRWTNDSGVSQTSEILIKKGDDGIKGDKGDSGAKGDKGDKGDDGIYPTEFEIVNDHFIITMSDNTTFDLGELPKEKLEISKQDGNMMEERPDGYYVSASGVNISKQNGNIIETKNDGLFVPPDEFETNNIDFDTEW